MWIKNLHACIFLTCRKFVVFNFAYGLKNNNMNISVKTVKLVNTDS